MSIEDIVLDSSSIVADAAKEKFQDWVKINIRNSERVHILDFTYYEVINALNTYYRRGLMNSRVYVEIVQKTINLLNTCQLHEYSEVLDLAIKINLKTKVTIYDATYIALAQKLRCKLLTVDVVLYNKLSNFSDVQRTLIIPPNN